MRTSPAFQFYPGDWRRDTGLQTCSLRARGLWAEMLWLMHEGIPYGHLTTAAGPLSVTQLAGLIHASPSIVGRDLLELETHQVFSRTDIGVIYSRRMVRDAALRSRRAAGGAKSLDHPNVPQPRIPTKDILHGGVEGGAEGHDAVGSPSVFSLQSSKNRSRNGRLPDWVATLPWPEIPPVWWTQTLQIFPDIDHEAVCRDAAAYWLEHPGKYRSATRFLRYQLARAFARRTPDPMLGVPCVFTCPTCGELHEVPYGQPEVCPAP